MGIISGDVSDLLRVWEKKGNLRILGSYAEFGESEYCVELIKSKPDWSLDN